MNYGHSFSLLINILNEQSQNSKCAYTENILSASAPMCVVCVCVCSTNPNVNKGNPFS